MAKVEPQPVSRWSTSEKSIPLQPRSTIAVDSQLDDKNSGRKYGLGSSAAVAGVIKGILEFYADLYPAVSRNERISGL